MIFSTDIHTDLLTLASHYEREQVVVVGIGLLDLPFPTLTLHPDETHKDIRTIERIWDFLLEHQITRRGLLICIGGGILTDLGGFAAATYKRGIDYVNVPTTLLAMVDASSGGKTGFNYRGLKNAIGSFYPAIETLIYPPFLQTLSTKEILSGFAEMLKTALLSDEAEWNRLMQYDLERMDIGELYPLIEHCVTCKEKIVSTDPREEGLRKALNLGHTFGHAIEEISLGTIPHGYAVLYGMIAELYLSVTQLGCPREPLQQLTQLMLQYYGRPQCKCTKRQQLITLMQQDKKNERIAEINCTLIHNIGSPAINQVISAESANEALEYLFAV